MGVWVLCPPCRPCFQLWSGHSGIFLFWINCKKKESNQQNSWNVKPTSEKKANSNYYNFGLKYIKSVANYRRRNKLSKLLSSKRNPTKVRFCAWFMQWVIPFKAPSRPIIKWSTHSHWPVNFSLVETRAKYKYWFLGKFFSNRAREKAWEQGSEMVFFTCGSCGDNIKKPKVEKHLQQCRTNELTCIGKGLSLAYPMLVVNYFSVCSG